MNKASVLSIIAVFLFLPALSFAQTSDISVPGQVREFQEQVSSTIEPSIPFPGEEVTISLAAYGTDLNRATITWTQNGKQVLKGEGEKTFVFKAGSLGSTDVIKAMVQPVNGPGVEKTFTISPAEVDLLWEASTYTPPFYKGKALFTPEADVTFIALPNMLANGSKVASNKAVYKWSVDYRVEGDKSGLGKNIFNYTGAIILSPHVFKVEAYASANPNVIAKSEFVLDAVSPSVNIYEDHPLYGILFNKSLLNPFNMNDTEKRVSAYPYFFSTNNRNSSLTYDWTINDEKIPVPTTETAVSFRKAATDTGTAVVKVRVNSTKKLLQEAFGVVSLYFNSGDSVFLRQ